MSHLPTHDKLAFFFSELEVTWNLDSLTNRTQRAFFLSSEDSFKKTNTIHLSEGKVEKIDYQVYLKVELHISLFTNFFKFSRFSCCNLRFHSVVDLACLFYGISTFVGSSWHINLRWFFMVYQLSWLI